MENDPEGPSGDFPSLHFTSRVVPDPACGESACVRLTGEMLALESDLGSNPPALRVWP